MERRARMSEQIYQEIPLARLSPSPHNPRKTFSGAKFDELVASVREKGVIEPILVRPLGRKQFEIVAGERRFRALGRVASENGGIEKHAIPAMVRDLDDEAAFDLMTIENLIRENLNELEEARGFAAYLDRHGKKAIETLADRTGINLRYIRRRVAVLKLPARILKDWERGRLAYGHLEQLMRVVDKDNRGLLKDLHKAALGNQHHKPTVRDWKDKIDHLSPLLAEALFDT